MAQFGSALAWGASGRRFKSGRPDLLSALFVTSTFLHCARYLISRYMLEIILAVVSDGLGLLFKKDSDRGKTMVKELSKGSS